MDWLASIVAVEVDWLASIVPVVGTMDKGDIRRTIYRRLLVNNARTDETAWSKMS